MVLEVSDYLAFQRKFKRVLCSNIITMLISTVIVSKQWSAVGREFLVIALVLPNGPAIHCVSVPRNKIHGEKKDIIIFFR